MKLTKAIITAMEEEADLIIKKYGLEEIKSDKIPKTVKIFEWERKNYDEDCQDKIVLVILNRENSSYFSYNIFTWKLWS